MTDSPTSSENRAENAERDIPTSAASEATEQSRAGSRRIDAIADPIWGSRKAPSQPVCAAGSVSIQARIAWITVVADGKLGSLTSHGELDLPESVFLRIELPQRLLTDGLGMSLPTLIKDPLGAAGAVEVGELAGEQP